MLRTTCPQCNSPIHVDESLLGSIIACPSCGQQMRLPSRPVAAETAPPEASVPAAENTSSTMFPSVGPAVETEEGTAVAEPEVAEATPAEPPPRPTLPRFSTTPYRPDHGLTVGGVVQLLVQLSVTAGVLGFLASFIGQWFYLILIFPFIIGAALGGVGILGIRLGKVRNPWLAGGAGFLAGVLAMTSMHYFDYLRFDREFPEAKRAMIRAALAPIQAQIAAMPKPPAKMLLAIQAAQVHDFPSYVDFAAKQGVTISHGAGNNPNGGMNLGYVGTYIYWLVEMLIVAIVAFSMMRIQASQPFCTTCRNWKQKRAVGTLGTPAGPVIEAVREGDVNALWNHEPKPYGGPLAVFVSSCQQCGHEAAADVLVQHVTTNKKGQVQRKDLVHMTYPGEAVGAFELLFKRSPS